MIIKVIKFFVSPIVNYAADKAEKFLEENPEWVWNTFEWMNEKGFTTFVIHDSWSPEACKARMENLRKFVDLDDDTMN